MANLLIAVARRLCRVAVGRFVDDFFGVSRSDIVWHGGKVLETLAELTGIPLDMAKNEDSTHGLCLLGAETTFSLDTSMVTLAVDATKAAWWHEGLQEVLTAGVLEDWRAAKIAGRMQFLLSLNLGRVGRAYVRPLYLQASRPLPGSALSAQARRSCVWFAQYLVTRPVIGISAWRPRREHVVTWSDAAGNRRIAVFLFTVRLGWRWTAWRMPKSVQRRLLPRGDNQIGYMELAAVAIAMATFSDVLTGSAWTAWVDNQGVVGGLLRGGSTAADSNAVIGQLWLDMAKWDIAFEIGRVASRANIADEPTRGVSDWCDFVGATFTEPVIPDWLRDPWRSPDFPHGRLQ